MNRFSALASHRGLVFVYLGILAGALGLAVIPGVFIIDEMNYTYSVAAMQHGGIEVPGVAGFPARRALRYFIPGAPAMPTEPAKVVSNAPPLYAFFALPFSWLGGWQGLIWLNIISMAICAWLVFDYTRRFCIHPLEPWLALLVFTLGSYVIEYALGVWPHCLSAALCMGGFYLSSRGRHAHARRPVWFLGAGLLLGLAAGVRYPNIVFAAAVLLGMVALLRQKSMSIVFIVFGMMPPLLLTSYMNYLRQGMWNPVSKSENYTSLTLVSGLRGGQFASVFSSSLRAFLSRVFDFSLHDPLTVGFVPSPQSEAGAVFCMGVLKKSWMQSIPWVLVVLLVLLIIVFSMKNWRQHERFREREMLAIAPVVLVMVLLFTAAGAHRVDGLCFNQRYFFDVLPLVSVVFAWTAGRGVFSHRWTSVFGAAAGAILVWTLLRQPAGTFVRDWLLRYAPLLIGLGAALAYPLGKRVPGWLFPMLASTAIGWAGMIHLMDDMQGSRMMRRIQAERLAEANAVLPYDEPFLLLTYYGFSVGLGPLQLSRDAVIADAWIDGGESAPSLIDAALSDDRRVFVVLNEFYKPDFDRVVENRKTRWLHQGRLGILEIESSAMPEVGITGDTPDLADEP